MNKLDDMLWWLYGEHSESTITCIIKDLLSIDFVSLTEYSPTKEKDINHEIREIILEAQLKLLNIQLNKWIKKS